MKVAVLSSANRKHALHSSHVRHGRLVRKSVRKRASRQYNLHLSLPSGPDHCISLLSFFFSQDERRPSEHFNALVTMSLLLAASLFFVLGDLEPKHIWTDAHFDRHEKEARHTNPKKHHKDRSDMWPNRSPMVPFHILHDQCKDMCRCLRPTWVSNDVAIFLSKLLSLRGFFEMHSVTWALRKTDNSPGECVDGDTSSLTFVMKLQHDATGVGPSDQESSNELLTIKTLYFILHQKYRWCTLIISNWQDELAHISATVWPLNFHTLCELHWHIDSINNVICFI